MSLFAINRFLGDEDEEEVQSSPKSSHAQLILQKIHERAKERKRHTSEQNKPTDNGESAGKKSGKRSRQDSLSDESCQKNEIKSKQRKVSAEDTPEKSEAKYKIKKEKQVTDDTTPPAKKKSAKKERKSTSVIQTDADSAVIVSDIKKDLQENESDEEDKDSGIERVDDSEVQMENEAQDEGEEPQTGQPHREIGGFTVIGDVRKRKTQKVQRVLPDWLANPSIVKNNLKDKTAGLDIIKDLLEEDIVAKLRDNGISHLFPVQRLIIPVLLGNKETSHLVGPAGYRPSDICCSAPTGSGKTLAFVLPIVQALQCRVVCQVRALIVLPVRDLATQVYKVFVTYCKQTKLKVGLIVGQKSFHNEQMTLVKKGLRGLQSQVDIIVATPGRLVDHIKQTEGFNLHHLRYLVIDEADRMMENIKQDWLTQVEQAVYGDQSQRTAPLPLTAANACKGGMPLQKLLFSATLSQNPEKLQQLNLFQPKLFTSVVDENISPKDKDGEDSSSGPQKAVGEFAGKYTTPEGLSEFMIEARDAGAKPLLILYLLHCRKYRHVLCFTNTVEATHRLYLLLKLFGGLEVREFSSNLHGEQRARILNKFAAGKIDVLICSDAMARGMDIDNVQCVIAYDHAPYVKTYIHRIGRTARAGKAGTAITLLEEKEIFHFKKMMKEAGKPKVKKIEVTKGKLKVLVPEYQKALQQLPAVIEGEKKAKR